MRLLVTGGAGFIGSHTVDALLARSHDVAVLDDLSSGKREQINPRARFHPADLRDARRVTEIIEQERPEVIFHLAAQMDVRRSVADPAFDAGVNLVGLLNLMEAARTRGLKRVIFASSGGAIYGEQDIFPCDESHPCRPVSPYGVAKLAASNTCSSTSTNTESVTPRCAMATSMARARILTARPEWWRFSAAGC